MHRITEQDIERVLAMDDIVKACPRVVAAVTEAASNPDATARDLAKIIATDEAITTRILRLVNSAFYGLAGEISTVTQAAVILGMREIKSLVYSVPVGNLYSRVLNGHLSPEAMWDHSVSVAVTARELSYIIRYPMPEEVFVGGIIHDVGKVVLSILVGGEYADFLSGLTAGRVDLVKAEEEEYGYSHSELGGRLLERWAFPSVLVSCARFHHDPVEGDAVWPAAALVYLADLLTTVPTEASFSAVLQGKPAEVMQGVGLDRRKVAEAYRKAADAYEEVRRVFAF